MRFIPRSSVRPVVPRGQRIVAFECAQELEQIAHLVFGDGSWLQSRIDRADQTRITAATATQHELDRCTQGDERSVVPIRRRKGDVAQAGGSKGAEIVRVCLSRWRMWTFEETTLRVEWIALENADRRLATSIGL